MNSVIFNLIFKFNSSLIWIIIKWIKAPIKVKNALFLRTVSFMDISNCNPPGIQYCGVVTYLTQCKQFLSEFFYCDKYKFESIKKDNNKQITWNQQTRLKKNRRRMMSTKKPSPICYYQLRSEIWKNNFPLLICMIYFFPYWGIIYFAELLHIQHLVVHIWDHFRFNKMTTAKIFIWR